MTAGGYGRDLIDGRFELLQRLGGGGMGLVWRARDTALHREVALKEVRHVGSGGRDDDTAAQSMRERVLREARALARLHHPNVVTIHHIVDTPALPYPWLVMELVTGGSLQDRLERGPLAPEDAARIGRGLLGALRAAHAAGILHRDVKPANVLLRADGSPVLTDFGIAALQEATGLTATGSLIGSPEYIAPERIRGEEGNPASDLWSLGVLLYVAVEGYNPLRRATSVATLAAVLDQPIPEPAHSGPLAPVLAALLVRDPAGRPDSESLDRMFAAAEAGGIDLSGPPAHSYESGLSHRRAQAPQAPEPWLPRSGTSARIRRRRRPAFRIYITATAVAGVIGALAWTLSHTGAPTSRGATTGPGAHPTTTGGTRSAASATTGAGAGTSTTALADPSSGSAQNLLTGAGMPSLINALRTTVGGTKVVMMKVYPDYATIDAPTRADPSLFDEYEYRNGVLSNPTPGGTVASTDGTVDLTTVSWSALPRLFAEADARLGVANPTTRYVALDPTWLGYGPSLRIYEINDYGGGYLHTDVKGNIIRVYPFS